MHPTRPAVTGAAAARNASRRSHGRPRRPRARTHCVRLSIHLATGVPSASYAMNLPAVARNAACMEWRRGTSVVPRHLGTSTDGNGDGRSDGYSRRREGHQLAETTHAEPGAARTDQLSSRGRRRLSSLACRMFYLFICVPWRRLKRADGSHARAIHARSRGARGAHIRCEAEVSARPGDRLDEPTGARVRHAQRMVRHGELRSKHK